MAGWKVENTLTVNEMEDAASRDWSISGGMNKSSKQVKVTLNSGRAYQYLSFYPVCDGDVVVIGNKYPAGYGFIENDKSSNAGQMGTVDTVEPKVTVKKARAVELDLVFTENVTKKTIASCVKYLDLPDDEITLRNILLHGKYTEYVYPITFLIRKLLMAASVIAHPEFAAEEEIEKAKAYIHNNQEISDNIKELTVSPAPGADESVCRYELHIHAIGENGKAKRIDACEVSKYALMGAISIMVRGGFANLLKAFLSAKPPISEFYDEMLTYLGDTGNPEALEIIRDY